MEMNPMRQDSGNVSRRSFIQMSAGITTLTALGGLSGCAPKLEAVDEEATESLAATGEENGEWITAACWHNCGGRCLNKALVVDGAVIRQKTDDTHEDSPDYPQARSCVRGRSQRNQVFSADRIKYPLKRKHWEPLTGGQKELRGIDEWERISWDEALDYVAAELKHAKEAYGNRSIFMADKDKAMIRTMNLFGGYTGRWGTGSYGGWALTPQMCGFDYDATAVNDRLDYRNCETVIMMGLNPAWSSGGNPMYHHMQVKEAGAKFIAVDPFYNDSYMTLGAEWIPCYPGQDVALLLGIAYELIQRDYLDHDFLDRCTIGFDAEHMPESEDPKGNFKDYVLGTYDGVPKDAAWASELCGVAPEDIAHLAEELNPEKKVALICGWAAGRTDNADSLPQLFMTIGAMTGHMGKSGHMCGVSARDHAANGGPYLVEPGSKRIDKVKNPVDDCINDTQLWEAILSGTYNFTGASHNKHVACQPGEQRDIDIHVIIHASRSLLQSRDGMSKGIEAHRKVDFVVTLTNFLTTNAMYSDIVLPANTPWERPGGFDDGDREKLIMYTQVTESLFESKSDQWIAYELAKKLGVDETQVMPFDEKQQFFNEILGATVVDEDGKTKVPLITVTQEDIDEWGCEGEPQEGKITLAEYKERGIYQVERKPGDNYGYIAFEKFREDPDNNPLEAKTVDKDVIPSSKSGKMEIFCRELADAVNGMGYSTIQPIPTYISPVEGYQDTFANWEAKEKGEYPYQVINPHYLRRSHGVFDNVEWLREAWRNPVFISAADAAEKGIADGDTVLITSKHGRVLRIACVTQRFIPGVIGLPHGAWPDIDPETGIDRGGADNILRGGVSTGAGLSGFNSCICNIEKYDGEPLHNDVDKPRLVMA